MRKAAKTKFDEQSGGKPYKSLNVEKSSPVGHLKDRHFECVIHSAMEHFGIKEHTS
jgi:hypothetical protein